MKKLPLAIISLIFLSSCVTKTTLGDFTVMSTNNVSGLHASQEHSVKAKGESCFYQALFFFNGSLDGRYKEATRNAISNGKKDLPDGDILVDAVVSNVVHNYPFFLKTCVIVEGDLVNLKAVTMKK